MPDIQRSGSVLPTDANTISQLCYIVFGSESYSSVNPLVAVISSTEMATFNLIQLPAQFRTNIIPWRHMAQRYAIYYLIVVFKGIDVFPIPLEFVNIGLLRSH